MVDQSNMLTEDFARYFRVELVTSKQQEKEVYGVRYRVYCEEFNYVATDVCPDQLETDEFDKHSLHCLIIHKESGRTAGCVRLVSACEDNENGLLPFEKYCKLSINDEMIDNDILQLSTKCEISRLAVDGAFRRRLGEKATRFGEIDSVDWTKHEQRTFSLIAIAGFLAATALTDLTHKNNVFAMMEPFLPRLFKRSGIVFQRVGGDIDYHGIRAPYFITTQAALDSFSSDLKIMYDWVYQQIEVSFNHHN